MTNPINGLMNMEMMLYGGRGINLSAPSMYNNYCAQPNFNNLTFGNLNPAYYQQAQNAYQNQNLPSIYNNWYTSQPTSQATTQGGSQATTFSGLSESEAQALTDYYAKNLEPSESLRSAIISGGIGCAVMQNPRMIVHPINYLTTTLSKQSEVNKLFKGVKESGTALNTAWKENSYIMEEAFSQMHRAEARSKWKIGAFRGRYTPEQFKHLKDIMEKALTPDAAGNIDVKKVAEATEQLRYAYCRNGWLFKGWNKIQKVFTGKDKLQSPLEMLDMTNPDHARKLKENIDGLKNYIGKSGKGMKLGQAFKRAGGPLAIAFGALEILMNWSKVKTAQAEDEKNASMGIETNYAKKQKTQTITKGIANSVGWAAGETLGIWAYAKLGATVGTALGPGVGTAIGATIGFVCGSVGMWLASKTTKKIMGEDVANQIEAQNKMLTAEGQMELLNHAIEQAENGEKMDDTTRMAMEKAIAFEKQKQQYYTPQMQANPQFSYLA